MNIDLTKLREELYNLQHPPKKCYDIYGCEINFNDYYDYNDYENSYDDYNDYNDYEDGASIY